MTVDWKLSTGLTSYPAALSHMEGRVAAIRAGSASEQMWLLEHPPLYTAGTSAHSSDLKDPHRFPVFDAGRGGQYTYHGPGQRVGYVMLDLNKRGKDLRRFIWHLEQLMIDALYDLGVLVERKAGRVGVWVTHSNGIEEKIAAIGVRVRQWVTFHGFAINVCPDLSHFDGIIPCGIAEHGVTSLEALGNPARFKELDAALLHHFDLRFGREPNPMPPTLEPSPKADKDPIRAAHDSFI